MVSAPITSVADPRWVRAIAHPLRIRLLAMLDEESASPVVLAARLGEPLGTVSYHVRILFQLGLLDLVSTRQRRGATEHIYRALPHPLDAEAPVHAAVKGSDNTLVASALDQIHNHASRSAAAGGFDRATPQFTRTPLKLDQQGWHELAQATRRWLQTAESIEHEATAKASADASGVIDAALVLMLFEALPFSAVAPQ